MVYRGLVGTVLRRRNEDQGATLIEAAVVIPVLLLVIVGIMEFGLAFKDFLTVSYLSREGARIGALAGDAGEADCAILTGLGELVTPGDLARIQEIQIYKASPSTGNQGANYNRATFVPGEDPAVCTPPTGGQSLDGWAISYVGTGYPPTSRSVAIGSSGGGTLDIIGVRVILQRTWITGFGPFNGSMTVNETTITRLEPEVYGP